MICPLSTLAELATSELQSGKDFSGKQFFEPSHQAAAPSKLAVLPKRRRTTGGSSGSWNKASWESPTQQLCIDYKTFFSRSFKPFKMKSKKPPFPVILMAIMSASQNEASISFLADNQSFIIISPAALCMDVLPVHFEDSAPSFEQFVDILATWGFSVGLDGRQPPHLPVYRHELFRRGDWESCLRMVIPNAHEISISRRQYRDFFQALGANTHFGSQDHSMGVEETRIVSSLNTSCDRRNLNLHDSCSFSLNSAPSLAHIAHQSSLLFANKVGSDKAVRTSNMEEVDIHSATDEVVSAAMTALHFHGLDANETHNFRRHTIDYANNASYDMKKHINPNASNLDVITEAFLERSMARKLQSRRDSGLLGSNLGMTSFLARTSAAMKN